MRAWPRRHPVIAGGADAGNVRQRDDMERQVPHTDGFAAVRAVCAHIWREESANGVGTSSALRRIEAVIDILAVRPRCGSCIVGILGPWAVVVLHEISQAVVIAAPSLTSCAVCGSPDDVVMLRRFA